MRCHIILSLILFFFIFSVYTIYEEFADFILQLDAHFAAVKNVNKSAKSVITQFCEFNLLNKHDFSDFFKFSPFCTRRTFL